MGRKRILVVDDSKVAAMTAEMMLGKDGAYDITRAEDGAEAVRMATEELPDLILMDIVMPTMNGFEAVRELRLQESTKEIPIIMVTTRAEAANVETGYDAGCSDYINKPINGAELLGKVRDLLED